MHTPSCSRAARSDRWWPRLRCTVIALLLSTSLWAPMLTSDIVSPAIVHAQQAVPWLPGGVVQPTPAPGRPDTQRPGRTDGHVSDAATTAETLDYLNGLRTLNGLPALAENASWSDGAAKHSRYVVRTGTLVHDEVDAD